MRRLLIANRGEIALRILRACQELGIETVAAYSLADRNLRHLVLADQTVCVGRRSYLDIGQMLAAATSRHCDAVHPGYGFLSENADFCQQAEAAGLAFVGPTSAQISMMGNKSSARATMAAHGVPVLPGSLQELGSVEEAIAVADKIGWPVMVKASHGGGGQGIAVAADARQLQALFPELASTAEGLFTSSALYLEKYLTDARHIELQVFGDGLGQVRYLGARDCSIQRRHQKLIEEAPPAGIETQALLALSETCCLALSQLNYRNAGTLEFLYQDGAFYFIEMNTRIQVEHPVTEVITNIDLVKLQLEVVMSPSALPDQDNISSTGHAIECRINAEDRAFRPAPGRIEHLAMPGGPGIRIDSHIYQGYQIGHEYDSLLAKIIAFGTSRAEALARMNRAIRELQISPGPTNRELHLSILEHPAFISGDCTTRFIEDKMHS